jgi:hypothetical protein
MSFEDNITGFGWYSITLLIAPFIGIGMIVVGIKKKEGKTIGWGVGVLALGVLFYIIMLS